MKNYIQNPKSVKLSEIKNKEKCLSAFSFKVVSFKNHNFSPLSKLLSENKKGFEPGSSQYIKFTKNYFIRISELDDSNFTFVPSNNTNRIIPPKKTKIRIIKGDICYQTASNVGNVCIYNGEPAFFNSHIRKLSFSKNKFYIFALLKSQFCKNQVEVGGSIKGVDNFREEYLLNTKIPFPTTKNHKYPNKVEKYVSLLVQNIINKEEQISQKNILINNKIEKELRDNKKKNNFKYNYPKISEIKNEKRLDTGLYEKEFKKIDDLINNYTGGFFQIPTKNFKSGSTPKIRLFNPKNKKYNWVTPTNIFDEGFYNPIMKIDMTTSNNINTDCILFINRTSKGKKGEFVGITCFYDVGLYGKGQHNQGLYRIDNYDKEKLLFITTLINSRIFRKICGYSSIGSKMKELKSYDFSKIKFPEFPNKKKNEIIDLYYHKLEENFDLTLNNYLVKELERNKIVGIFQLNIEIFKLKKELENIIDKIVMNEKINIPFI